MQQNTPQSPMPDDEISLWELIQKARDFFARLRREKRRLLYTLLPSLAIGLLLAFGSTPQYEASLRIMPYRAPSSGGGGLGSLAGLAGIKLPSRGAEETIQPEMYPDIAQSLDFRMALAETPLYFGAIDQSISPLRYWEDYARPSLADQVKRYTIGLPGQLLGLLSQPKATPPAGSGAAEANAIAQYDQDFLDRVEAIGNLLAVETETAKDFNAVTSLRISATLPDAHAAAGLAQAAANQLMEAVIDFEIRKIKGELDYLERHHADMQARYHRAQAALAEFRDRNRSTTSAETQSEMERLQNEFSMAYDLYRSVRAELEQARIKLERDTPVFATLEKVVVPNEPASPRKVLILFAAFFIGLLAMVAWVGLRMFWEQLQAQEASSSSEQGPPAS